jgi:arginine/ornithine transport system substrate-binding protein
MGTNGVPQGFDVDIARAMCEELGKVCEFVPMDWDGLIPALQSQKIDTIISAMSITDKRLKVIDFTKSYYHEASCTVMRDGVSPVGKTIGVLRGSTDEAYANGVLKPQGVKVVSYTSQQEAFLEAANTRLDGVMGPLIEVDFGFLQKPEGKGFSCVGGQIHNQEYYGHGIGMAVRKTEPEQLAAMNKAIDTIRTNGKWQRVSDKYFSYDIW